MLNTKQIMQLYCEKKNYKIQITFYCLLSTSLVLFGTPPSFQNFKLKNKKKNLSFIFQIFR